MAEDGSVEVVDVAKLAALRAPIQVHQGSSLDDTVAPGELTEERLCSAHLPRSSEPSSHWMEWLISISLSLYSPTRLRPFESHKLVDLF